MLGYLQLNVLVYNLTCLWIILTLNYIIKRETQKFPDCKFSPKLVVVYSNPNIHIRLLWICLRTIFFNFSVILPFRWSQNGGRFKFVAKDTIEVQTALTAFQSVLSNVFTEIVSNQIFATANPASEELHARNVRKVNHLEHLLFKKNSFILFSLILL